MILLVAYFFLIGNTIAKPPLLTPCDYNNNFKTCAIEEANAVLPKILHGDKSAKIPSLLPLHLPKVAATRGSGSLNIEFIEVDVFGFDTFEVLDIDWNIENKKVAITLEAKKLNLDGQYNIDGKILILPITGSGICNITGDNIRVGYTFTYDLIDKNGVEYAEIKPDDKMTITVKKAYFDFKNLFNGNKEMGNNVNNFLNENDQDVVKELYGSLNGVVAPILRLIINGFLSTTPFNGLIKL